MKNILLLFFFFFMFLMASASASDMDCFRLESAKAQHKQSKWYEKIKAYKAVKELTVLCKQ